MLKSIAVFFLHLLMVAVILFHTWVVANMWGRYQFSLGVVSGVYASKKMMEEKPPEQHIVVKDTEAY